MLKDDPDQISFLKERLLSAVPDDLPIIRDALKHHKDQLVEDFWSLLKNPTGKQKERVLQAASALALLDPESDNWRDIAGNVADELASVNPILLTPWMHALSPASSQLVDALIAIYRNNDGQHTEIQRRLATSVLGDYAADRPDVLADLLLDAEPKQFRALYPKLAAHRDEAIKLLNAELDRTLSSRWNDPDLEPSWATPDPTVAQQIKSAHGLLEQRFAFCQTMPLDDFIQVAEALRQSGYRPTRFRPYASKEGVNVAAVWTRDGREWQLLQGLTADEIRQRDEELRADDFIPVDVAGYTTGKDGELVEKYGGIWARRTADEDARICVDASYAEHKTVSEDLVQAGFPSQHSLQIFCGLDGKRKHCSVITKQRRTSSAYRFFTCEYSRIERLDEVLWDIDVVDMGKSEIVSRMGWSRRSWRGRLHNLAVVNSEAFSGNQCIRVTADIDAPDDISFCQSVNVEDNTQYLLSGYVKTSSVKIGEPKGNTGANLSLLGEINQTNPEKSQSIVGDTDWTYIHLVFDSQSRRHVTICARMGFFHSSASGTAWFDDICLIKLDEEEASSSALNDPEFLTPIRRRRNLVKDGGFEFDDHLLYGTVWQNDSRIESAALFHVSPAELIKRCNNLVAHGFRPKGISVALVSDEDKLLAASVWHRPVVSDEDKEILAKRQCNAAIGLLRLKETRKVWPLLTHSPDPRVRTWIIHRLSPMGASPQVLAARLDQEADVSSRRALILALGEYDDISPVDQKALSEKLIVLYREDPDPGVHESSEWLLRRWGKQDDIASIDAEFATSKMESNRRWYINGQGQTMVIIPGPVEFLMGSPAAENDQYLQERLHRQRIGHSFAMATKETTVEEFQRCFRATNSIEDRYGKRYAPDPDCPQTAVTWYKAAAYCRWLSEQEGIAEDQMCYPKTWEIIEGMRLPKDYLSRTGYRLPSEAEWEYACRAGTISSRYYGETEELLGEYAWYLHTANDRTWPVANLKPNDVGLFDMQGNALEWCQELFLNYPASTKDRAVEDREDTAPLTDRDSRVLRGGSFYSPPSGVRSASRGGYQPANRANGLGFRIARTIPSDFFTASPDEKASPPKNKTDQEKSKSPQSQDE